MRAVAVFATISSLAFVASTLLFLPNRWPMYLSVPVLLWLLSYSVQQALPTSLAHCSLEPFAQLWRRRRPGSPCGGGSPRHGRRSFLAWAVLLWVAGFDIIYALPDVESRPVCENTDSIPQGGSACVARYGSPAFTMRLMIVPLLGFGVIYPLGWAYFTGVTAVVALLVYERRG